jgi:hypothetical protein
MTKKCFLKMILFLSFSCIPFFSSNIYAVSPKASPKGPVNPFNPTHSISTVQAESRVHDVGNMRLSVTNWGYLGNANDVQPTFLIDPCTGEWSPQLEYPKGSDIQYMWQTGLWIGAIIKDENFEYARVSEGISGIDFTSEMYPGHSPGNGIVERSNRSNAFNCLGDYVSHPDAISEQDFISSYTDTNRYHVNGSGISNERDGPHVPLGIKITQKSYAWSYNYAKDFIIVDFEIENIADKFLKNVYVGLYVDGDVGHSSEVMRFNDDICGFIDNFTYLPEGQQDSVSLTINSAWIADNDGRPDGVASGSDIVSPDIMGARVVRAPNPKLRTSFNWWIVDSGNPDMDFGPAWEEDGAPAAWTTSLGTPLTDPNKYFLLSNREFDFDQVKSDDFDWIANNPQLITNKITGEVLDEQAWKIPNVSDPTAVASGWDARYLISWGPLGIFDYLDQDGERVYRLNPGEKFSMTVAYVGGRNFHDRNNPQASNLGLDESKFSYFDFQINSDWAAKVYDNPMIDTNGDTWFGEDTGLDGLYSKEIGDTISFVNWDGTAVHAIYPGPDEGEMNGLLEAEEDMAPRPAQFDYTAYNQLMDFGDGVPDFQGPPPPPSPNLGYRIEGENLILTWAKFPSEDEKYADPFSQMQDFEGYRVYLSNSGLEDEFSLVASFDYVDYGYFSDFDSLMTVPIKTNRPDTLSPIWTPPTSALYQGRGFLGKVDVNTGMSEIAVTDSTYELNLGRVNPFIPIYYSVTAFDFGNPRSGLQSLESAKLANSIFVAPSGSDRKKPGVVPNPYRANENYTRAYNTITYNNIDNTSVSWENRDDGSAEYWTQTDRRLYFYNLPEKCLIRIFTVSGDLVQVISHDSGNKIDQLDKWNASYAEPWDLNNRNKQQVVSGLYIFSVEDKTSDGKGITDVGKFVIIR